MITMTSLDAQTQFGTLIDTSQREPITVTRRGRPVAVVMSFEDYRRSKEGISVEAAKALRRTFLSSGEDAGESMRRHLGSMSGLAEREGLTEEAVMKLLNEPD